jgi:hypothetical protein
MLGAARPVLRTATAAARNYGTVNGVPYVRPAHIDTSARDLGFAVGTTLAVIGTTVACVEIRRNKVGPATASA